MVKMTPDPSALSELITQYEQIVKKIESLESVPMVDSITQLEEYRLSVNQPLSSKEKDINKKA